MTTDHVPLAILAAEEFEAMFAAVSTAMVVDSVSQWMEHGEEDC